MSNPGPGTYNSERVGYVKNKEPSWRIGTGTRDDILKRVRKEGLPGPGNYGIHSKAVEGRKYAFGKEEKCKITSNQNRIESHHIRALMKLHSMAGIACCAAVRLVSSHLPSFGLTPTYLTRRPAAASAASVV